ncbi:MAG: NDP-sugar synthase, partial [Myxococcota bacterium]
LLASHHRSGALATMVVREDPGHPAFGAIGVDDQGAVRRLLGEGPKEASWHPMMFTGCHVIEPKFLEYLPPEVESCIVRYGYRKALANGESIHSYRHDGLWLDAGTPELFLKANRWFLDGRLQQPTLGAELFSRPADGIEIDPSASVDADATLLPPVSVGPNAKILAGARVGPRVVVQDTAIVGAGARIEDSVVFPEARVEDESSWTHSLLGRGDAVAVDTPSEGAS